MEPTTITALLAIIFTLAMVTTLFIIAITYMNRTKKTIDALTQKVNDVAAAILESNK